jgi:hypothetical protein
MSQRRQKHIDAVSTATIVITLMLFAVAVFEKGFTHDLLLEAGVFLVSVKLILSSAKTDLVNRRMQDQLDEIQTLLRSQPPAGSRNDCGVRMEPLTLRGGTEVRNSPESGSPVKSTLTGNTPVCASTEDRCSASAG